MIRRWKPEDVFTPRRPMVNEAMYIPRDGLENALLRATKGTQHMILSGDSGCGKSWLFKKVFEDNNIEYLIVDCANVDRFESLDAEFRTIINRKHNSQKVGYTEKKTGGIKIPVAEASLTSESEYKVMQMDPFERVLQLLRLDAKDKQAILVIENLEAIIKTKSRMSELANIITLCDNPHYAQYDIKILIVGVPKDVRTYFSKTLNQETVSNRIRELPDVEGLDKLSTETFIKTGFNQHLGYDLDIDTLKEWGEKLYSLTMGIPLHLHELCLEIASIPRKSRGSTSQIDIGAQRWTTGSMNKTRANLESLMNTRKAATGRRNQVLFALGKITRESFTVSDIEFEVRSAFPESTNVKNLNVGKILQSLSKESLPIIRNNGKGKTYSIEDKRYAMVIRSILYIEDGIVKIVEEL